MIVKQYKDWYRAFVNGEEIDAEYFRDIDPSGLYFGFWEDEWIEIGMKVYYDQWNFITGSERDRILFRMFEKEKERRKEYFRTPINHRYDPNAFARCFQDNYDKHD